MASLPAGVTVFERGWLSANNILLSGPGQTALVDSGYCTHATQTVDLVAHALDGRALDLLINTHLHSDHCGGNAALQERHPTLQTLIPPGLANEVRKWDTVALTYAPTGQQCPRFHIDGVLQPGKAIRLGLHDWEVHAAPGHDQHSVVLFEPQSRTLISADALWENGFGVVFQELEGERAFEEVAQTLDVIESLRPALVIPGHGSLFADVAASLAIARKRLDGFVQNPKKHATHAAKVLLKFKLLELQDVSLEDFTRWAVSTTYFQIVHARWFAETPLKVWLAQLTADLERSGAAKLDAARIINA